MTGLREEFSWLFDTVCIYGDSDSTMLISLDQDVSLTINNGEYKIGCAFKQYVKHRGLVLQCSRWNASNTVGIISLAKQNTHTSTKTKNASSRRKISICGRKYQKNSQKQIRFTKTRYINGVRSCFSFLRKSWKVFSIQSMPQM